MMNSDLAVGPLARNQPPLHQRDLRLFLPPSLLSLSSAPSSPPPLPPLPFLPSSLVQSLSGGDQNGGGGGLSILLAPSLPLSLTLPPLVALQSARSE